MISRRRVSMVTAQLGSGVSRSPLCPVLYCNSRAGFQKSLVSPALILPGHARDQQLFCRSAREAHTLRMYASEEMRAAAAAYRVRASPGDAALADRLEEAARKAAADEGLWHLAGYNTQEQRQLAENRWQHELTIARALCPDPDGPDALHERADLAGGNARHDSNVGPRPESAQRATGSGAVS
jgi:hypothetical protein